MYNDIFKAYLDFVTAMNKNSAEIYAKSWQESVKFGEVMTKAGEDIWKNSVLHKNLGNVWENSSFYKNAK